MILLYRSTHFRPPTVIVHLQVSNTRSIIGRAADVVAGSCRIFLVVIVGVAPVYAEREARRTRHGVLSGSPGRKVSTDLTRSVFDFVVKKRVKRGDFIVVYTSSVS